MWFRECEVSAEILFAAPWQHSLFVLLTNDDVLSPLIFSSEIAFGNLGLTAAIHSVYVFMDGELLSVQNIQFSENKNKGSSYTDGCK